MECPRCAGTGTCAECNGEGKVVCPACNGKGQSTTPKGTVFDCKHCQGSGRMDCSLRCDSCAGSGEITDELRRQVRDKYTMRLDNTTPLNRVSSILLTLCVTFYIMQRIGGPPGAFIERYLFNNADGWTSGEIWRLISPMFLHGSWFHLGCNGYFLVRYCPVAEGLYGSRRFLLLYFLAGVCGNLFSWFGNCYLNHAFYAGIGASTSLFGVGAAIIALHYRYHLFSKTEVQTWALYQGVFLLAGFAGLMGNLDNWGHMGGIVAGVLFVWFTPRPHGR